jgi:hypothetical protein
LAQRVGARRPGAKRAQRAASRRRLCDLRIRGVENTCTCCGVHVVNAQQHMLRAHASLLTRSRRADADYATSERDAKRARRADADYSTSERDAKRAWRADAGQKNLRPKADYSTYERGARRVRRADKDYPTSERDSKRAPRADADQKCSSPVLRADAFSLFCKTLSSTSYFI